MPIALSTHLNIDHEELDKIGCYNTIMDVDSLFFINFLRLKGTSEPELEKSYSKLQKLLNNIALLLDSTNKRGDIFHKKALKLLNMQEFEEICLGYSMKGTSGAGSGNKIKNRILDTGKQIIRAGIKNPEIFELVGLFEENIGPDRIGDFIGNVIKDDLIEYSKRVIDQLEVNKDHYINKKTGLIHNPYNGKDLILLPQDILHELPLAEEWDDIEIVCSEIESIRDDINKHIGLEWKEYSKSDRKQYLKKLLLKDTALFKKIISEYKDFNLSEYDFISDPSGEATWYNISKTIAANNPLTINSKTISDIISLKNIVIDMCIKFKELIENNGLNEALYDDNKKPRKERISQKIFQGICESYCQANDICMSPETNAGRGAVDFKYSIGYTLKVIVEVKLTTNNRLDHGYNKQIDEYLKAEKNAFPIYLVIDNGGNKVKLDELIVDHKNNISKKVKCPHLIVIDAKLKPTASKI